MPLLLSLFPEKLMAEYSICEDKFASLFVSYHLSLTSSNSKIDEGAKFYLPTSIFTK